MNKKFLIAAVAVIAVLAIGAGIIMFQRNVLRPTENPARPGQQSSGTPEAKAPTSPVFGGENNETTPPPGFGEITVTGENYSFSPKEIRVKKGDTVRIVFKNSDGTHDWVIDEFNAKTPQLQTGQTATVQFVAAKAGEFEYYCSAGNHRQMGMVGKLIVEEKPQSPSPVF